MRLLSAVFIVVGLVLLIFCDHPDFATATADSAVNKNPVAMKSPTCQPPDAKKGMRRISGGTFQMGQPGAADSVHTVTVGSFWINITEVTQADYKALMGRNPSAYKGDRKPVESITWFDAILYCNARSKRHHLDTVYTYSGIQDSAGFCLNLSGLSIDINKSGFRLPTEAEWEFACRAGTTTKYYWGNSGNAASKYAWFVGDVSRDSTPQPVAEKKPNAAGLYDMAGNVWEWCNDGFAPYSTAPQTDPLVPPSTDPPMLRVVRGGDFLDPVEKLASGFHMPASPTDRPAAAPAALILPFFGLRPVLTAR